MSSAEPVELLARELAHGLAAGQLAVGVFELFAQLQPVDATRGDVLANQLRALSRDRRLLLSARDPALSSVIASSHRNQTRP
jgi:hypothetical protein